ncbi:probable 2-oxoglutarate-dependent dioxygenase AOP1 [Rhodamnia argentea]|uniref:Probable 2-oxoglutarate-dependent dioxygenase AOP1 n=1 Tax=Rhodamnia argentea TaxID=178133 RepID=A0A8B8N9D1_9MYRT|nr:probable 2-oxoglutarate-dependent dioxygenase AOP1 [Rhodamnia argentea]
MGSMAELKLPVIDFSSRAQLEWTAVRDEVKRALETYGCFETRFEKVPVELQKSTLGPAQDLFDLPLQTKLRSISTKPYHRYFGQCPTVPLFKSMGIDNADMYEKVDRFTTAIWPKGHPNFSKTMQAFSEKLSEVDKTTRRMISESLGVEKYLDEHINSSNYLVRLLKYAVPQATDTKLGLTSHTDKNFLTILGQIEADGLQVQSKDGEWFNVQPSMNSFIVMIGDSLHAWVNGRLHSLHHRVMMSGNKARYSVGLFTVPKCGYIIKAPDELVDEEHPVLFKPFDHGELLKFYYTEAGQRAESVLKTYCGV